MNDKIIDEKRISDLIERYFNAETTPEEERELKRAVATNSNPRYDEIRAVLGFVAMKKSHNGNVRRVHWNYRTISVAAMLAVVVAIAFGVIKSSNSADESENVCYAYIDGKKIDNYPNVMSIVDGNLSDVRTASDETQSNIQGQLDDIRNALKDID